MDQLPDPPLQINEWDDDFDFAVMSVDVDGHPTAELFENNGGPVLNKYYYATLIDPAAVGGQSTAVVQYIGEDGNNRRYRIWKTYHWVEEGAEDVQDWEDVEGENIRSLSTESIRLYVPLLPAVIANAQNQQQVQQNQQQAPQQVQQQNGGRSAARTRLSKKRKTQKRKSQKRAMHKRKTQRRKH